MGEIYDPKGRDLDKELESKSVCFCGAEYHEVKGAPLVPWAELEAKIESGEYIVVGDEVVVAEEYEEWMKARAGSPGHGA